MLSHIISFLSNHATNQLGSIGHCNLTPTILHKVEGNYCQSLLLCALIVTGNYSCLVYMLYDYNNIESNVYMCI